MMHGFDDERVGVVSMREGIRNGYGKATSVC